MDYLADDYELGARVAQAGYRVELSAEVVETSVPAYGWRGFLDHQLRWARTVRDARPWGYAGLIFTQGWAGRCSIVLASGLSPLSLWLLGLSFFLRLAQAMTVGAEVLGDHQVLPSLWLLPLRDLVAMGVWVAGFAGNTIVWRGERFVLKDGKLVVLASRQVSGLLIEPGWNAEWARTLRLKSRCLNRHWLPLLFRRRGWLRCRWRGSSPAR